MLDQKYKGDSFHAAQHHLLRTITEPFQHFSAQLSLKLTERQLPILPALSCHPVAMLSVCPFSSRQAADHPSENNFFRITQSSLKVFSHCLVQSNKNEKRGIFLH